VLLHGKYETESTQKYTLKKTNTKNLPSLGGRG
jgi:hypothetical protein